MPPKPPKSIEERVRLEFDRLSLGKMHEMGIQDRVEAIEGTLNSILVLLRGLEYWMRQKIAN